MERFLTKMIPAAHQEAQVQPYLGGAKSWTCGAFPEKIVPAAHRETQVQVYFEERKICLVERFLKENGSKSAQDHILQAREQVHLFHRAQ